MKCSSMLSAALAGVALLFGCSLFSIDPVIRDSHLIAPATNADSALLFYNPLTWANGPDERATHAVSLPEGKYSYEGENDDFRYFRAPAPVAMGRVQAGTTLTVVSQ